MPNPWDILAWLLIVLLVLSSAAVQTATFIAGRLRRRFYADFHAKHRANRPELDAFLHRGDRRDGPLTLEPGSRRS